MSLSLFHKWSPHSLLIKLFLFTAVVTGFSQDTTTSEPLVIIPDSITDEKARVDFMIMASWGSRLRDREKSFAIGRMAIDSAREKGIPDLEGLAYNLMGILYMQAVNYDTAEFYYAKAEVVAEAIADSGLLTSVKLNRAKIALNQGDAKKANEYGFQALKIFEGKKDKVGIAFAKQTIGQNFVQMEEITKAIPYFHQALDIYLVQDNPRRLATIYNDLGVVHQELRQNDSSLLYHQLALEKREEIGDLLGIPGTQMNMGVVHMNEKQYSQAKDMYLKARDGYQDMGDLKGVLNCNLNLGMVFTEEKNYSQARFYYQQGYEQARKIKNPERTAAAVQYLSQAHAGLGQFDQAYQYITEFNRINDSILSENKSKEILELESKYQTEKKDRQLAEQELNFQEVRTRDQRVIGALIVTIIASILIFVLLYNRYRYRQKLKISEMTAAQQKESFAAMIEGEEKERKRIARELHDGLGQLLSSAKMNISLLNHQNQSDAINDQQAFQTSMDIIDEAVQEVRHISHNMMPAALMRKGLLPALKDLSRKINASGKLKMKVKMDNMSERLEENKEIALYRIIQEITNNIIKHAEASDASINLKKQDHQVFLTIQDNGKGLASDSIETSTGIGWDNIYSRVSLLNGSMDIQAEPEEGTKVDITFSF